MKGIRSKGWTVVGRQGPMFMAVAESLGNPDDLARVVAAYRAQRLGNLG